MREQVHTSIDVSWQHHLRMLHMAKPNYQFEKRQRELEKKKKKEEKAQRKAHAADEPPQLAEESKVATTPSL